MRFVIRTTTSTAERPGLRVMPATQRMRWRHSVSPTHSVRLPSAFSAIADCTGSSELGRWWWKTFHSTPPEIHAPSIPTSAGFTTCCR